MLVFGDSFELEKEIVSRWNIVKVVILVWLYFFESLVRLFFFVVYDIIFFIVLVLWFIVFGF